MWADLGWREGKRRGTARMAGLIVGMEGQRCNARRLLSRLEGCCQTGGERSGMRVSCRPWRPQLAIHLAAPPASSSWQRDARDWVETRVAVYC